MNSPVRVLVMMSSMDVGGAETFLMKLFRSLDRKKIVFDFLLFEHKKCFYDEEILCLGGKIYYGKSKSKSPIKSLIKTYSIVRKCAYKVVFRCSEHPISALDLLAAKIAGARVRMIRSTNTSAGGGRVVNFLAGIFRPMLNKIATVRISPSTEAGDWLFGQSMMSTGKVSIMKNGIELDKFVFNQKIRERVRENLSLNDKLVVGHVGRFTKQKNHRFLLDVFAELVKIEPSAVLLLIGEGEYEQQVKEKVKILNLDEKVIFMGVRSNINEIMMAIDVFVFPSLYEGLPNVVVECQATGLPCIISDSITRETKITDLVIFKSINEDAAEWAEVIKSVIRDRGSYKLKEIFQKQGYDIKSTAKRLTDIILEGVCDEG